VRNVTLCLVTGACLLTLGAAPASVKIALPAAISKSDAKLVLHIEELTLPPNSSGIVRVFADLPMADATTDTADEHYLGYLTMLASNSAEAARGVHRSSITLDISHKTGLLADRKEVTITLVPLGGTSAAPSPERDKPTFARVYLVQD